ncbi:MAG: hypothetical protein ACAH95_11625 [Fimbriimonas sp.]
MLKRFALATAAVIAMAGCAGTASVTPSRFAGSFGGQWFNTVDADDRGTSEWFIDGAGNVEGEDFDPRLDIAYRVVGHVDESGHLVSTATPNNGTAAAALNGQLEFNAVGQITGVLTWGVEPPLSYNYILTRHE